MPGCVIRLADICDHIAPATGDAWSEAAYRSVASNKACKSGQRGGSAAVIGGQISTVTPRCVTWPGSREPQVSQLSLATRLKFTARLL